jgi:hypothetical protein
MTIYPSCYIKCCFITEYPSPKAIIIFNISQKVFGKLETVWFTPLHFAGKDAKAVMNNPPIVCGIPNCKEAHIVDFCGLQENVSRFDQHLAVKCSVLLIPFSAEQYHSLATAVTIIR